MNRFLLSIIIPVYNEEAILAKNIKTLWDFCFKNFIDSEVVIIIADNNSTDRTAQIADELAAANPAIKHLFIPQKGKGLAIALAWRAEEADVYGFMDADLSTDLLALPLALREIKKGLSGQAGADIVIGSRFHQESMVARSLLRRFVSQGFRWFFKILFFIKLNDFPCGFKVINKEVRDNVPKNILDTGFFWDTELLVLADKQSFKIKEIPVFWVNDPMTNVRWQTYLQFLWEVVKIRWWLWRNAYGVK